MRKNTGILYNYMQCAGAEAFVGADAYIGPAERTVFAVIFGAFVIFFGPTESPAPTEWFRYPRCCRGGHRPLQTSGKMQYGFALDFRFSLLPAARPLRRFAPAPLRKGSRCGRSDEDFYNSAKPAPLRHVGETGRVRYFFGSSGGICASMASLIKRFMLFPCEAA